MKFFRSQFLAASHRQKMPTIPKAQGVNWYNKKYIFGLCPRFQAEFQKILGIS